MAEDTFKTSPETPQTVPEPSASMVSVGASPAEAVPTNCVCKQYNLIWGGHATMTCEKRKKVVEVCKNIWGEEQKIDKANMLMAIMHLETAGTFSPSKENGKGYVGLIQFGEKTAESLGTTYKSLKAMTFVQQMDYVEKYLKQNKDKMKTLEDFYLQILKPNAVGNGSNPNYVLFDESITVPDGDGSKTSKEQRLININREPWVTKYGYASNPPFMKEEGEHTTRKKWVYTRQKYEDRYGFINGKTYMWEVTQEIKPKHYDEGKSMLFNANCENIKDEPKKQNTRRAPWIPYAIAEFNTYTGIRQTQSPLKERIFSYFDQSSMTTGTNTTNWCASFVNWCFEQTQEYTGTNSVANVAAFDWLPPEEAKAHRKDVDGWKNGEIITEVSDVFVGAVIVFNHSHVAFIVGQTSDKDNFVYLGGNQSDGGVDDGKGKRTICTNPTSKKGIGKNFWIIKPSDYTPTDEEKKLPILSAKGGELNYNNTHG